MQEETTEIQVDFWTCPRTRAVALGKPEDWHEFIAGAPITAGTQSALEIVGAGKPQSGPIDILLVCKFCGFKVSASNAVGAFHMTKPPEVTS